MDTLTHGLNAVLAARASQPKTLLPGQLSMKARSWAAFFAGIFPDSDVITLLFGQTTYLHYHRGITHSLILAPLWALLLSWIFSLISRGRYQWRAFYAVSLLAIVVHIFGDVITNYGTMVLAPFSDYKIAFSTTFIIDLFYTGIIVLGLIASLVSKRFKSRYALAGFVILIAYVLAQGWWQRMAIREAYATVPGRIMKHAQVYALAQPISPFNWKLIVALPDHYYVRYLNLFRQQAKTSGTTGNLLQRVDALYLPRKINNWELIPRYGDKSVQALAHRIWDDPAMAYVREFMKFPAVYSTKSPPNAKCVWFADQRFVLGRVRTPFIYGGCENRDGSKRKILRLVDGKPAPLN